MLGHNNVENTRIYLWVYVVDDVGALKYVVYINCKKPRFRRYFQPLPSRVYRSLPEWRNSKRHRRDWNRSPERSSCSRVTTLKSVQNVVQCPNKSSQWNLCRRGVRLDLKIYKFIRYKICYISIITLYFHNHVHLDCHINLVIFTEKRREYGEPILLIYDQQEKLVDLLNFSSTKRFGKNNSIGLANFA